jgi:thiamine biosynthesis lipoprotein
MLSYLHTFFAMGGDCAIHLCARSKSEFESLAEAAEAEIVRIEKRYSRYRADSELSRINTAAAQGQCIRIDDEVSGLVEYAKACFAKSDGAFDITSGILRAAWDFSASRPPDQASIDRLLPLIGLDKIEILDSNLHFSQPGQELDFGGLGKEFAADRAAEVCSALGAKCGFIDLAGDIRVIGPQQDGTPWIIGIRHPREPSLVIAQIALTSGALATSGDYERYFEYEGRRYCHILDPRTGWPVQGLSSVTVISDRCLVAGSLSTIAMLKGREGTDWLSRLGIRHVAVTDEGEYRGTEPVEFRRCS